MMMTVTTTEPSATVPAAKATPARKTTDKPAPAKTPAKTTAATKAAEANADDTKLVTHTREAEVAALIDKGWSRAALTREPELAGSTIMWRVDRLTGPGVRRLDALLTRIDRDQVAPPARKSTGGGTRTAGPSRTIMAARLAGAEAVLDAATSEKSAAKLREAIASALEIVRGETTVPRTTDSHRLSPEEGDKQWTQPTASPRSSGSDTRTGTTPS
jgi:hypothetical protein